MNFGAGLSIAFAIAEELQASAARTMFVTHYPQITSLAAMYPNVKNVHMRTSLDTSSAAGAGDGPTVANNGETLWLRPTVSSGFL